MLFQCSIKTIIGVQFYLCQAYISKTLCENKDKPDKCCEGKCYLKKQLDKEESREQAVPNVLKDKSETIFISTQYIFTPFPLENKHLSFCVHNSSELCEGIRVRVFNPPQFFMVNRSA